MQGFVPGVSSGAYHLIAVADESNFTAELMESNNATVGIPQWETVQVTATELSVSGTVLVSDLTSCPAVDRVDGAFSAAMTTGQVQAIKLTTVNKEGMRDMMSPVFED